MESEKSNSDYDKIHRAIAADQKIIRLAKIAVGMINKGATFSVYNIRKGMSEKALPSAPASGASADVVATYNANVASVTTHNDFRDMLMCFMAAFLVEDASLDYKLYDQEGSPAGLSQEAIKMLMEEGGLTETDFRRLKHAVEVDEEGTSKTNHKTHAESHTFAAITGGLVATCTGFDADGNPVYSEIKTNDYKVKE